VAVLFVQQQVISFNMQNSCTQSAFTFVLLATYTCPYLP